MSKLIVEMAMPENCYECYFSTGCSFCEGYDDVCVLAPKDAVYKWNFSDGIKPSARPSWCPIKGVLPDEHGDLIDRDEMFDAIKSRVALIDSCPEGKPSMKELFERDVLCACLHDVVCAEAVIAAERKDDEQIH